MKKKKLKKTSKTRWGLESKALPKYVQWMVDFDYKEELTEREKDWLNRFSNEYYGNTFEKTLTGAKKSGLHEKANIPRTELYRATNARVRDIYNNRARRAPWALDYESYSNEDAIIEKMDREREGYVGFDEED